MARQEDIQRLSLPDLPINIRIDAVQAMFDILEADIVILQETKIQRKDLRDDMVLVPGWDCYFSLPRHEKGKFGVVIYTRQSTCAPIRAEEGLSGRLCPPNSSISFCDLPVNQQVGGYPSISQAEAAPDATELSGDFSTLDSEGRCVILEFPAFVLIGVYNPATRGDSRNPFRIAFLNLLDIRVRNLVASGKRVVLAGDLNIIKEEVDMANAEVELRKRNMTVGEYFAMPSRRMLNQLVENGTVYGERDEKRARPVLHDICRSYHLGRKGMFTCWETKINARPGNFGSRIDYILCSLDMKDWFLESNIQEGLMGSDHCPVYAIIKDVISLNGVPTYARDLMNPYGMFSNGQRTRSYSAKDILLPSGRLLPEFNGRRSIRDMFARKSSMTTVESAKDEIEALDMNAKVPEDATGSSGIAKSSKPATFTGAEFSSSQSPSSGTNKEVPSKGTKRGGSGPSNGAAFKKSKSNSSNSSRQSAEKGQQSLKGFFKSTNVGSHDSITAAQDEKQDLDEDKYNTSQTSQLPWSEGSELEASPTATRDCVDHFTARMSNQDDGTPADAKERQPKDAPETASLIPSEPGRAQEESKETWSKLFAKPVTPRCEGHDEPCKVMVTKKPGINCGRSFWMCAKPLGPSGMKEKGTEWRCGTFIWCSDRNS